jgi:hypothetical protein
MSGPRLPYAPRLERLRKLNSNKKVIGRSRKLVLQPRVPSGWARIRFASRALATREHSCFSAPPTRDRDDRPYLLARMIDQATACGNAR